MTIEVCFGIYWSLLQSIPESVWYTVMFLKKTRGVARGAAGTATAAPIIRHGKADRTNSIPLIQHIHIA